MSYLTEINCKTILEAIKSEKIKQRAESEKESKLAEGKKGVWNLCSIPLFWFVFCTEEEDYVNINTVVNPFWTDLFANCFLVTESSDGSETTTRQVKNTLTHDDMLFFVSKLTNNEVKITFRLSFVTAVPRHNLYSHCWNQEWQDWSLQTRFKEIAMLDRPQLRLGGDSLP